MWISGGNPFLALLSKLDTVDRIRSSTRNKATVNAILTNELGKLPPNASDVEEVLLGAILVDKEALSTVMERLKPEHFYRENHKKIYESMLTLFTAGAPIDIITVVDQLRKDGILEEVGGAYAISELSSRVSSGANAEYYSNIIVEKYLLRELIRLSGEIQRDAFEDTTDVLELLDTAESKIFSIVENNMRKGYANMSTLIRKAIEEIDNIRNKGSFSGVPTGFLELDKITSGFQRGTLNIVAARPAMGKTAFVLSLARNVAVDYKRPVAVFSLEMGAIELVNRLISGEAEVAGESLKKGSLSPEEFNKLQTRIAKLAEAPIYIDDTPQLNLFNLRAIARRLVSRQKVEMIIIDYLQLMSGGNSSGDKQGNREQEISAISRGLKGLAKELNIPIIALSQLSRAVETRGGDKKPMLSDLRESGSIEQDADIVMFIYRPEYYKIEQDADGNDLRGIGQLLIEKHRNGSTGTVNLRFIGKYAKFDNLDHLGMPMDNPFDDSANSYTTITMGSRMNDFGPIDTPASREPSSDGPIYGPGGDAPF